MAQSEQHSHQHGVSSGHIPDQRAPGHWGHPRALPSPTTAGVHHHGMPAHPSYPDQLQKANKWMFPLCEEPVDDITTCCEGFWFPYSLYGKINYRTSQMRKQKDPRDLKDYVCCNDQCCLLVCGEIFCLQWVMIQIERAHVRSMFSIEGRLCEDWATSFFCGRCVLMQLDREIRAREEYCCVIHNMEARNSFAVSRQPSPHPEMVAVPQTWRRHMMKGGNKHITSNNLPAYDLQPLKPAKIRKRQPAAVEQDCLGEASSGKFTEGMAGTGSIAAPLKAIIHGDQRTHFTPEERQTIKGRQPWRATSEKRKQKEVPDTDQEQNNTALLQNFQVQELDAASSGDNHFAESETSTNDEATKSTAERRELIGSDEEVVVYYDDDKKCRPHRHRLADCARIRASTPGMADIPCIHTLSDDDVVSSEDSDAVEKHNLDECNTTGKSSNRTGSYFPTKPQHHLADCLDKRGASPGSEDGLVQHILTDCDETILKNKVKRVSFGNIEQVLARRGGDRGVSYEPDEDAPTKLHILEDCAAALSQSAIQMKRLIDIHDLAVCPRVTTVKQEQESPFERQNHQKSLSETSMHHLDERTQIVPATPLSEAPVQQRFDLGGTTQSRRDSNFIQLTEEQQVSSDHGVVVVIPIPDRRVSTPSIRHHLSTCGSIEPLAAEGQPANHAEQLLFSSSDPIELTAAAHQPGFPTLHLIQDCEVLNPTELPQQKSSNQTLHELDECDTTKETKFASKNYTSSHRHSSSPVTRFMVNNASKSTVASRTVSDGNRGSAELRLLPKHEAAISGDDKSDHSESDSSITLLSSSHAGVFSSSEKILPSSSQTGAPAISWTGQQHELVKCDVVTDEATEGPTSSITLPLHEMGECDVVRIESAKENEIPTCSVTSNREDEQHAAGECITSSSESVSKHDLSIVTNANITLKQHEIDSCNTADEAALPTRTNQHVLEDCDDEPTGSAEQGDGPSDKSHFIPPPPSTPSTLRAFSPQTGRRTPSAAESALRHLLGNLGGEPLDGSSDVLNRAEIALDIGIAAPAPSVATAGNLRPKTKSGNRIRNQKQKNRGLNRSSKCKMSPSSAI